MLWPQSAHLYERDILHEIIPLRHEYDINPPLVIQLNLIIQFSSKATQK